MSVQTPHVTRYRVTLDFTVNDTNCVQPSNWNWKELLQLKDNEKVKEVYVENLGQIASRKYKGGRRK
tara:strand:- start:794 stop:994 length:201 start_codon:yes stop_codon:yes gene_type:complete